VVVEVGYAISRCIELKQHESTIQGEIGMVQQTVQATVRPR
jgi:hypothetical protein